MRIFVFIQLLLATVITLIYFIFNQSWYAEMLLAGLWHGSVLATIITLVTLIFAKQKIKYFSLITPLLLIICVFDANSSQWRNYLSIRSSDPLSRSFDDKKQSIIIAQHNTGNLNADTDAISAWLMSIADQVDIIFLVEVKWAYREQLQTDLAAAFPYQLVDPNPNKRGQAFFSKIAIVESQLIPSVDPERDPDMYILLEPPLLSDNPGSDNPWLFLGIHPHAPVSREWFNLRNQGYEKYTQILHNHPDLPIVLAGDFNATQYNYWFRKIRGEFDFTFNTSLRGTAPSSIPQFTTITIDHFLHSNHWQTTGRTVGNFYGGNHSTVITRLTWRE